MHAAKRRLAAEDYLENDSKLKDHIKELIESSLLSMKSEDDFEQYDQSSMLNSVVRIYCTHSQPNYCQPWQRLRQEFSTSSGFIISQNQILTNAHAVEYGSLIQVKKRKSEKKFLAKVVAVGHECDLAILSVEDEMFWEDTEPL